MARHSHCFAGLVVFCLLSQIARADEDKTPANERTASLIKQLDTDESEVREKASRQLAEIGKSAIPALTDTVLNSRPEPSHRAFNILAKHFESEDKATKAAAKAALESIVEKGRLAQATKAEAVLESPAQQGPFRILGGRILPQGAKKVTAKTVNGVKEIEAEETERKVKIKDDPKNGIRMEITTTKDGKETTKKYQAKSADDLKKKHPDAHKTYEKYTKAPARIPLRLRGLNIPLRGLVPRGGRNAKRISIKVVNGLKEIEAEENGRKVKIKDHPENGIEMEVTETKDGKETTSKYKAKSADDLKKNHPDAHKLYEKYNQKNGRGAIQIRIQRGPIQLQKAVPN